MASRTNMDRMQQAVRVLIQGLGEDVDREGLRDTPKRVAKALLDCTQGYRQETSSTLGSALFHEPIVHDGGEGIVVVRDIDFASTSEETLLPFHGRCHVAYRPKDGVVLGLSKLARLTRQFAKRLQSQERLALEIAHALQQSLDCHGVAVLLQAKHLCNNAQPLEHTCACVSGLFAGKCSTALEEVYAVLGLDTLPAAAVQPLHSRQHLVAAAAAAAAASAHRRLASAAALSTASDSPAAAPSTPDASEKDTDGDSDDLVVEVACCDDMEAAVQQLLAEVGEDPQRPGLRGAARRYVMSLLASTSGYHQTLPAGLRQPRCGSAGGAAQQPQQQPPHEGEADAHGVVSVRLPFTSQCEHHMLPFYGSVMLSYLPGPQGEHLAQADVEQVVAMYTQRLQVQERITHQLADALRQLCPASQGVMVVCDAAHMCMVARGVENHSGSTTSFAVRGAFESKPNLRTAILRAFRAAAAAGR